MKTHSWRSVRSVVRNARPKTRRPPIVGHRIPVSVWHILRDLTTVIVDGGRDAPVRVRVMRTPGKQKTSAPVLCDGTQNSRRRTQNGLRLQGPPDPSQSQLSPAAVAHPHHS